MGAFAIRRPAAATPKTGDPYIDHGARCDNQPQSADCFLDDAGRARLIGEFHRLVDRAAENYKGALAELKFGMMIEKEEDLHWVVTLALDLLTGHLATVMAKGLNVAKKSGASKLMAMGLQDASRGNYNSSSWAARAESALSHVSGDHISAVTKAGASQVKDVAKKGGKNMVNQEVEGEKGGTISYMDQLRDTCDQTFHRFSTSVSAGGTDGEIVAAWNAMQPPDHTIGAYKAKLGAHLKDFKKSGANQIGHSIVMDHGMKDRIKRVVYVRDVKGNVVPWYQNADVDVSFIDMVPRELTLERPVPEDFRDVAIARSESRFGVTPTLDDGFTQQLKATGQDPHKVRQTMNLTPPNQAQLERPTTVIESAMQAFGHYTDPPHPLAAPPAQLPTGSVFGAAPVQPDPLDPVSIFRQVRP